MTTTTPQKEPIKVDGFGDILSEAEALGWQDTFPDASDPSYGPDAADDAEQSARDYIAAAGYTLEETDQ
jgi:hypothetical protein